MSLSVTLKPTLKTLLSTFQQRCDSIRRRQNAAGGEVITTALVSELRNTCLAPLADPTKAEFVEELHLLATLSVVIDLVTQGWRIVSTSPSVVLDFPESLSPEGEKERIRRAHLIERDSQVREASVTDFIHGMEKRRLTSKGWHSIYSLMRDGEDLSRRLSDITCLEDISAQNELLAAAISPYIQIVETDAFCAHTGLRLSDIWRYFRHTWVTSYKSVPGRSMMILVRDAAAVNHPIIGIASLASSVVQQTTRDKWIGWDTETVIQHLRDDQKPTKRIEWLMSELDAFIKGIYVKDLLEDGLITRMDLRKPTGEVIAALLRSSEKAIKHHRLYPHAAKHKQSNGTTQDEWAELAETSLFRSKRTKQLATMLSVRAEFQKVGLSTSTKAADWRKLFETARFRQSVGQIIRLVKSERVGINMMDISVCGAVAPYNSLLGGKLVSLLLCSPEIVKHYAQRYGGQKSLIASAMRGASVKRNAQLVLLCTTSLYGSALNQYSRLKMPTHLLGSKTDDKIEYDCLGTSKGFGSFQFSKDSLRMMAMLLGRSKDARKVNSIFGEGVNPLMRKIREGLSLLGLPAEILLKHGSKRLVYGVALASNFQDFLLGLSKTPKYLVPQTRPAYRTQLIADYWRHRWLLKRIAKPGVLQEVARHACIYPMRHGAQVDIPNERDKDLMSF